MVKQRRLRQGNWPSCDVNCDGSYFGRYCSWILSLGSTQKALLAERLARWLRQLFREDQQRKIRIQKWRRADGCQGLGFSNGSSFGQPEAAERPIENGHYQA